MKANHNCLFVVGNHNLVGINIRKTTEVALDNESKSQRKDARLCVSTCWDKYQKNRPRSRQTGVAFDNESKLQPWRLHSVFQNQCQLTSVVCRVRNNAPECLRLGFRPKFLGCDLRFPIRRRLLLYNRKQRVKRVSNVFL